MTDTIWMILMVIGGIVGLLIVGYVVFWFAAIQGWMNRGSH